MAHYYLNVRNGNGYTSDDEGAEFESLDAARATALAGIRSILSEEVLSGMLDLRGQVEITDPNHDILLAVSFESAVSIER